MIESHANALHTCSDSACCGPRPLESLPTTYSELQTVIDKGRDRGASTLAVCYTAAAGLLDRDTEETRAAVTALVYDCSEFTVFSCEE
ncbi:hypothetical protein Y032_0230g2942 [Ancylostoma ceylanicum]|uniref:Uncharacterized protein n=1 Tax=Ancylostoma ceylanicum TaxID=53326 RepID=A0A016SGZ2_9BILA|nr:hypothetical protein Y032_0230g2942 [Ancylostoma ceylanicum]